MFTRTIDRRDWQSLVLTVTYLLIIATLPSTVSGSPFEAAFASSPYARGCPESYKKFEIMSGYAFTSPADSFASIPGCLELSSCLSACRFNESCLAVNFETGLCVLLSSSAQHKPQALKESQFPVFTIYAHKVCLSDYGKCAHTRRKRIHSDGHSKDWVTWVYERVPGHQLALIESTNHNPSTSTPSNGPVDSLNNLFPTIATNYIQSSTASSSSLHSPSLSTDASSIYSWTNGPLNDNDNLFGYSSSPSSPSFLAPSSSSSPFLDPPNGASSFLDSPSVESHGNYFFDSAGRSKEFDPLSKTDDNLDINAANGKYLNKPRYLDVPSLGGLRNLQVLDVRVSSLLRCAEACLQETSFICLSANFLRSAKRCTLMSFDRHTVAVDNEALKLPSQKKYSSNIHRSNAVLTISPMYDYIEMNCRGKEQYESVHPSDASDTSSSREQSGQLLCEFKPLSNVALKTVDAIFEEVSSINECKKKCLDAPFQCYSFDMGDDTSAHLTSTSDTGSVNTFTGSSSPSSSGASSVGETNGDFLDSIALSPDFLGISPDEFKRKMAKDNKVRREKKLLCRISHLDRASLSHLKEPYSHLPGVTTYERSNCFNIKVNCGRDKMKAFFSSNKPFTGKIYSTKAAATCTQTLNAKNYFSIDIPYYANGVSSPSSPPSRGKPILNGHLVNSYRNGHHDAHVSTLHPPYADSNVNSGKFSSSHSSSSSSRANGATNYRSNSRLHRHSDCGVVSSNIRGGRRESSSSSGNFTEHSESHHGKIETLSSQTAGHMKNRTSRGFISTPKDSTLLNGNLFMRFSVSLVLQKHALIVTSSDFDVTLNCDYDLSQQRIISNSIQLISHSPVDEWNSLDDASSNRRKPAPSSSSSSSSSSAMNNQIEPSSSSSAVSIATSSVTKKPPILPTGSGIGSVHPADPADPLAGMKPHDANNLHSPVVRMSITDRDGGPVRAAEVGDPLSLRFEITSEDGHDNMYDVFVKSIFADDGADISELELIDSKGCPTDPSIMGPPRRVKVPITRGSKIIEAPFEAFKFPTSAIVQFRALIVPCLTGDCQPVLCTLASSALTSSNLAGYPSFVSGSKASVHSFGKRSVDSHLPLNGRVLTSIASDMIVPIKLDNETTLKEVEERVYIEILDKKNDNPPEEDDVNDMQSTNEPFAIGTQDKLNYDTSDSRENATSENTGPHGDSDCYLCRVPLPWIICCACLMTVQVIALSRYYCGSRSRLRSSSSSRSFFSPQIASSASRLSSSPLSFTHPNQPPTRMSSVD